MKVYGLIGVALVLLVGCASPEIQRKDGSRSAREFSLSRLVKADSDVLAEINQRQVLEGLRRLTEKLYRRNPHEYRKAGLASAESATARLFASLEHWADSPYAGQDWESGFRRAFAEDFSGDRVQAYMGAMLGMVMRAYGQKSEFFLTDGLDAQLLYNSARNVEVAVWKLTTARQADGRLFLLSNAEEGGVQNLSFEREFGKVIALQDVLALFIEDKGNRSITRVVQGAASLVFLPI